MDDAGSPGDNTAYRFPVSVKGIVCINGKVPLLLNERNEWELPGGKLELGESPYECIVRELFEEINVTTIPVGIIDAWTYSISREVSVFIVTFACRVIESSRPKVSHEHRRLEFFALDEIGALNMPDGYKKSIGRWREFNATSKGYKE